MGMEHGPWESSGSEHSAEDSSLSAMVNSFMEMDFYEDGVGFEKERDHGDAEKQHEARLNWEERVELRRLVCVEKDTVNSTLLAEVQKAIGALEDSSRISCRELMTRLRSRGLDAGLCKSKWLKQGSIPAGEHEYIDIINTDGTRYIVELSLAGQFTIARPTSHYASLIETVPEVFVSTVEEMKQVVKLMCKAMKVSMGCRDMKVPPWRKHEYTKAKWFGSYKRTTKSVSTRSSVAQNTCRGTGSHHSRDRSVGFEVLIKNSNGYALHSCRDEVTRRARMEQGLLAAAFRAQQTDF